MGWDCLDGEDERKKELGCVAFGRCRDHLVLFDSILANFFFCVVVGRFGDYYTLERAWTSMVRMGS